MAETYNENEYIHQQMQKFEHKLDSMREDLSELKLLFIPKINEIEDLKNVVNEQNHEIGSQKSKIQHLESKLQAQEKQNNDQQKMVDKMETLYYRVLYGGGGIMLLITFMINFEKILNLLNKLGQ